MATADDPTKSKSNRREKSVSNMVHFMVVLAVRTFFFVVGCWMLGCELCDLPAEKRRELVERTHRATSHMSLTVSALLSMAREQKGEAGNPARLYRFATAAAFVLITIVIPWSLMKVPWWFW